MTNADKLRAMSDEELATFITKTIENGFEWFDKRQCDICTKSHGGVCPRVEDDHCDNIDREVIDWLKAKAE